MFLQIMNQEEREKFLEFVYKVANIDGEYAEEEREIINSYKQELGLTEVKDTAGIDALVDYFSLKSIELKRVIYFETTGLINSDDNIAEKEAEVLFLMKDKFKFDESVVRKIDAAVKKLQTVYDEIYDVLFE